MRYHNYACQTFWPSQQLNRRAYWNIAMAALHGSRPAGASTENLARRLPPTSCIAGLSTVVTATSPPVSTAATPVVPKRSYSRH